MISLLSIYLSWSNSLEGQCIVNSGSLWRERGHMNLESRYSEVQCSGSTIDQPIQCGCNHHSWVSFTHFFKAAFNLSCASQSMPLMWWCPSFTYSIFDLSHFIQLNPVEVDSHRHGSPSFLLVLPPCFSPHSCSAKCSLNQYRKSLLLRCVS